MLNQRRTTKRKRFSGPRPRKKLDFKVVLPIIREETVITKRKRKREKEEEEEEKDPVSNISYVLTQILKLNRQLFTMMDSVQCLRDTVKDLSVKVSELERQVMYGTVRETVGVGRSLQDHFNELEKCTMK